MNVKSVLLSVLISTIFVSPLYADDMSFKLNENDTSSKFKIIGSTDNELFTISQMYPYTYTRPIFDFFARTLNITQVGGTSGYDPDINYTSYAQGRPYTLNFRCSRGDEAGEMVQLYNNNFLGVIQFQGVNSSSSSFVTGARIDSRKATGTNTSSIAADLRLQTYSSTGVMNYTQIVLAPDGYVGIGDYMPDVALDVNGDILADSYNDHSPLYISNNALKLIKGIKHKKGTEQSNGWAKVDHDSLPDGIVTKHREIWVRSKATGKETKKGRLKLGKVKDEERDAYIANNYVTFEKEVPTRDLGATLQLVLKGVQELAEQNERLMTRIEKLEKAQATIKS